MISGSFDKTVGQWDLKTACEIEMGIVKKFEGHASRVYCIDTSADSKLLASGSHNTTAWIWILETGKLFAGPLKRHTKSIGGLALSFDGTLLTSTSYNNTIKLWAFESRQLLTSFHIQNLITLVLSPDLHQLAYTKGDQTIYICEIPPDVLTQASACIP
ncbi:WD40 repeat-like protein, partial [Suillus decipiens]